MTATLSIRPTATDHAGWFNRRLLTRTAKSSMVGHHYFFPSTASLPVTHPLSNLSLPPLPTQFTSSLGRRFHRATAPSSLSISA